MCFVEHIQQNSEICNNCFRRVATTQQRNYFLKPLNGEMWAKKVDRPDRRWVCPSTTQHQAGDEHTDGTIRGCVCGARNMPLRPVSKSKFMRYVERVAQRLQEEGVEIDEELMRREAYGRITDPKWQGKQDELLDTISELAH